MKRNKSTKEKSCLLIYYDHYYYYKKYKLEVQYSIINPFSFSLCFE